MRKQGGLKLHRYRSDGGLITVGGMWMSFPHSKSCTWDDSNLRAEDFSQYHYHHLLGIRVLKYPSIRHDTATAQKMSLDYMQRRGRNWRSVRHREERTHCLLLVEPHAK